LGMTGHDQQFAWFWYPILLVTTVKALPAKP
jgi:hypothetical protein